MEWQEVEAFLAVADVLHFGRAAERLHVSQPRISQLVRTLERRIGASLFDRSTRQVSLTMIGRDLLAELGPAHRGVIDSIAHAKAAAQGVAGTLAVGFYGALAGRTVLDALADLRRTVPELEIQLRETQVADPCRPLREGDVEVLLTQFPVDEPGISTGPIIYTEPWVLAVPARHSLARRASVPIGDLARYRTFLPAGTPPPPWLSTYLPWTTPGGEDIARGRSVHTFQELLTLVAADEGLCPVCAHNAEYHARPDIAYVPMTGIPPLTFGLAWRTNSETHRLRTFVNAMLATRRSTHPGFNPS